MVATLILVSAASLVLHGCTRDQPPPTDLPKEKAKIEKPQAPPLPTPPKDKGTPEK